MRKTFTLKLSDSLARIFFCVLAAVCFVNTAVAQETPATSDRLVLLDGTAVDAVIEQIDAAGKITGASVPEGLVLYGLRRVERFAAGDDDRPVQPAAVVDFVGGGQLQLSKFTIDDKQDCHLHNAALGEVALPIDVFRAVRWAPAKLSRHSRKPSRKKETRTGSSSKWAVTCIRCEGWSKLSTKSASRWTSTAT